MCTCMYLLALDDAEDRSDGGEHEREVSAANPPPRMASSSANAFEALAGNNGELEQELDALRIVDDPKPQNGNKKLKNALIWIDLEMTGLDVNEDSILQIAVVITDGQLQSKVVGPELTIHHSDEVLSNMNEWCIEHHGKSGLTDKVRESTVDMASAGAEVMEFIEKYAEEGTQIAGNSVHVDVQFLKRLMPRITDYCHYRIVDVSSIGELCRRWYPKEDGRRPRKVLAHTAMSDILESIEQLKYYRKAIFKK